MRCSVIASSLQITSLLGGGLDFAIFSFLDKGVIRLQNWDLVVFTVSVSAHVHEIYVLSIDAKCENINFVNRLYRFHLKNKQNYNTGVLYCVTKST